MRGSATIAARRGRTGCALVLMVALLAPACTKKPQKDVFVEHWETQAQKSEGFSPTAHPRKVEFSKATITAKKEEKTETKPAKPLSKQKVTLRMYDTDLVAVIRAMARAAGQNVVLSSGIPGSSGGKEKGLTVNVNVVDAPWDETFQSILSSNGLTYAVEGDIIRVMTLDDMERQNKLKEARNKMASEAVKAKELEPYVTARVEINYSELPKIYATLSAMCGQTASANSQPAGQQPQPGAAATGQTPRDITPTSNPETPMKMDTQQGGRLPGQLNCTVVPDQHSNSIIVQGPPSDAEKLVALIEELDKPRPQVRLKAYIVQATRDVAHSLGVQWGGKYSGNNFQLSPGTTSTDGTTTLPIFGGAKTGKGWGINNPGTITSDVTGLASSGTALNFIFGKIGENVLEAQLTALATESKVKILSTPTITTMENMPAFVENGQDVPYVSTSQNGTNVQFAHATLKLEMTPHVVDGTNLRMKILVKDDQVDTKNTVQGNPYIYKRETQSNLVVEDGDTIIISGLTRDTVNDSQDGLPYLSNIPLLGWAFKSKTSEVKREDMLIFIIPTILKEKPIAPVPPVAGQAVPPRDMALSPIAAPAERP